MSSQARKLADLINDEGDVKKEHLDKVAVTEDTIKSLKTKVNFNLGLTEYKTK